MATKDALAQARREAGMTQEELARKVYVTRQAVSRWENDTGLPDITMAVPLARALGTTTDELLRFGERYQEFEDLWRKTLRAYGDDPAHLLPVALAALKEFHHDKIFLFRAAVDLERLAEQVDDPAQSSHYIGQALVHARLCWEMDPDTPTTADYYRRLQEKVTYDERGECVLKSRL